MRCSLSLLLCVAPVFVSPIFAQWTAVPPGDGRNGQPGDGVASPVMDAMGDAVDAFGLGPPLLDIDTLDVTFGADTLIFSLDFFNEISPPSTGAANGLVGVIDLDVDQNILTGGAPLQNSFSPPFSTLGAGIDFRVDLSSDLLHPGMLDVLDASFEVVGTFPADYTSTSVSGRIPLTLLADDDGVVDFTAIIGTVPQPTDAMDVVGFSVPVPEPTSLTWSLLITAFLRRRATGSR